MNQREPQWSALMCASSTIGTGRRHVAAKFSFVLLRPYPNHGAVGLRREALVVVRGRL